MPVFRHLLQLRRFRRPWLLAAAALTGGLLAALALLTPSGCSNCASDCPNFMVQIVPSRPGNLDVRATGGVGPACPPIPPRCQFEGGYPCGRIDVVGVAPGICDVTLGFGDRAWMVVRTQFRDIPAGTCCRGFPVVGENTFVVPSDTDGGITGQDGAATDAVWIAPDAGDGGAADGASDGAGPD